MEIILDFLVDNYLWFLIISLILVFGLIGYIVDSHEKKTPKLHFQDNDDEPSVTLAVNETKSLKEMLEENENNNNLNVSDDKIDEVVDTSIITNDNNEIPQEELQKKE